MIPQDPHPDRVERKAPSAVSNSATVVGFLLFFTGVLMVLAALIDIVVRIDSLRTALYLIIGLVMYKVGRTIMHHFATLKTQRKERRRHTAD